MNLVLWCLLVISATEGFNISELRRKRNDDSPIPNILMIKYHHQDQVKLVVLKKVVDSTLAGPFMQLWSLQPHGEISEATEAYDDPSHVPTFYHGENSFSAVTYFPRSQTLHGVLDQSVYIENLPLRNVNEPDLVDTFLHPIPGELESKINSRKKRTSGKRKFDEEVQCSSRKRFRGDIQKKILYPEIFLIVDVSSRRIGPAGANQYDEALMYVLTYWNAVDMLYRKLQRTDVRLNIAGILIGKQQHLETFGLVDMDQIRRNDSHVFILKNTVLDTFGRYFHENPVISRHSFDFLIWMTNATLIDPDVWIQEDVNLHDVKNDYSGAAVQADCGGMHLDEFLDGKISNRAIVMYDDDYAQYHVAARGLARLMLVADDDVVVAHDFHHSNCLPTRPMVESSGIMDPSKKRLDGYLFWSYCSEIHFETYAKSKSSCCALNYPHQTMDIPDIPDTDRYITVQDQCACYGMRAPDRINYGEDFCSNPLRCESENGNQKGVALPLDGTPCLLENAKIKMYCIHQECP